MLFLITNQSRWLSRIFFPDFHFWGHPPAADQFSLDNHKMVAVCIGDISHCETLFLNTNQLRASVRPKTGVGRTCLRIPPGPDVGYSEIQGKTLHIIAIHHQSNIFLCNEFFMASRMAQIALVDVLFAAVAIKNFEGAQARLEKKEALPDRQTILICIDTACAIIAGGIANETRPC